MTSLPSPGEELELVAGDLAFGGESVFRTDEGFVLFAPFASPGDRCRLGITEVHRNFARARVVEVVAPGPARAEPACPWFGDCGGCQWQHVALSAQREAKERIVRTMLGPAGMGERVTPLRHAGGGLGYRNRLILPLRSGRGGLRAGFFRAGSHRIVEVDSCAVQHPALWEAARSLVGVLRATGLPGWDEARGRGFLRHLVLRTAAGTGELGAVLVTAGGAFPGGEDLAWEMMRKVPSLAGIARNVNPARTNVILGPETVPLAGRSWLRESVGGMDLRASLPAFFQANHAVTCLLLDILRSWTEGVRRGVLDLYCGVGLLGLAAARNAERLIGIEEDGPAVEDAKDNAARLGPPRSEFHAGRVEDVLPALGPAALEGLDAVIVDPPRKGLDPSALGPAARLGAPLFIYVSCDPATFSRDLKGLGEAGLELEEAVPLDMFPQTYHIELIAKLRRR